MADKDYIGRALERACLRRERFAEGKVPESLANLVVIPFFGDMRSEFILSTLLLNHYKQANKSSYLVVCSWPGHHNLYPYADEYWSLADDATLGNFSRGAIGFYNERAQSCERTLLRYFDNVVAADGEIVSKYYKDGLTSAYLKECRDVMYSLPHVPSVNLQHGRSLSNAGKTVFIHPVRQTIRWQHRGPELMPTPERFWTLLAQTLIDRGYTPVVYQNYSTYDLSSEFESKCIYITESDLGAVLGVMRTCDCVLDVFSGLSRLAYVARCPVVVCDERQRFVAMKEYEIDDLCGSMVPKKYIFSFTPVLDGDSKTMLIEAIANKLDDFIPTINREKLPAPVEREELLSYGCVRKRQLKRLGARFIVPPQRDEF